MTETIVWRIRIGSIGIYLLLGACNLVLISKTRKFLLQLVTPFRVKWPPLRRWGQIEYLLDVFDQNQIDLILDIVWNII
jgi:hypothetical protein